jgi:hypothetical protein
MQFTLQPCLSMRHPRSIQNIQPSLREEQESVAARQVDALGFPLGPRKGGAAVFVEGDHGTVRLPHIFNERSKRQ